jgi:hypothetical protein
LHKNGGKIGLILNRMEGIFLGDWWRSLHAQTLARTSGCFETKKVQISYVEGKSPGRLHTKWRPYTVGRKSVLTNGQKPGVESPRSSLTLLFFMKTTFCLFVLRLLIYCTLRRFASIALSELGIIMSICGGTFGMEGRARFAATLGDSTL